MAGTAAGIPAEATPTATSGRQLALPALPLPEVIIAGGRGAITVRWILSRALTFAILVFAHEGDVAGDVRYYGRSLSQLFHGGTLGDALQEYPLPVLGLLVPQFLLGALNQVAFMVLFVLSMLAVDAAFTVVLWRADGRHRGDATNLWLWFVPAIGPLAYFRFDLVPAVLAGGAVLVAVRRPALAGALTALGASLKLWPAVMLPTFLIRRADRKAVLTGFLSTGILLGGLSLAIAGPSRTVSPLHWQTARGLQIEAVSATPLMFARIFDSSRWPVGLSRYKAFEISGPGVHVFEQLSSALTVLGGALLIAMWWRAHKHPKATAETLGWLFLATALIVTVTNKTLSPQYLLWLGGPIAALAVRAPANPAVRRFGRLALVAALLTQLEYPIGYNAIVKAQAIMPLWMTVLAARNVLLVYLTWFAARQVWRLTRADSIDADPVTAA
ncbi:glycosyltransferase 87 family protein [Jatrophihabitans sp. DSM 45814]